MRCIHTREERISTYVESTVRILTSFWVVHKLTYRLWLLLSFLFFVNASVDIRTHRSSQSKKKEKKEEKKEKIDATPPPRQLLCMQVRVLCTEYKCCWSRRTLIDIYIAVWGGKCRAGPRWEFGIACTALHCAAVQMPYLCPEAPPLCTLLRSPCVSAGDRATRSIYPASGGTWWPPTHLSSLVLRACGLRRMSIPFRQGWGWNTHPSYASALCTWGFDSPCH